MAIRELLATPIFHGMGCRKIQARLRHQGIRTSKDRVLRLLRQHKLLSPARHRDRQPAHPHVGNIVTEPPNQMGGTGATKNTADEDGTVTIFAALDH
jgi:putative transposase